MGQFVDYDFFIMITFRAILRNWLRAPDGSYLRHALPDMAWPPKFLHNFVMVPRKLDATDPRDRIWGLLGVCQRIGLQIPPPSREKSKVQVFVEYTIAVLEFFQSLAIIYYAHPFEADPGLTSWTPDFCQVWDPAIVPSYITSVDASKSSKFEFRIEDANRCLVLKGISLGTIQQTIQAGTNLDSLPRTMKSCATGLSRFADMIREAEPHLENSALFDRLVEAQEAFADPDTSKVECRAGMEILGFSTDKLRSHVNEEELWRRLIEARESPSTAKFNAMIAFISSAIEESYFKASGNYLGKAVKSVQVGDVLVLISGSPLPLLLRRRDDHYRYVGFAYAHGIMQGEVWNGDDNLEEFRIY
jgi:hypothetical protein